ncbi:MAG: YraN family protein, partial [Bacteroidales bacterium]|nr:YraN family protein [Bacteroidales bacterium]
MKTKNQIIGKRGEDEACSFLVGQGHRIVRRNWRWGHLEVDVITLKDRVLHIVEVKTRSGGAMAPPESKVDAAKRRRLVRAANAFLG